MIQYAIHGTVHFSRVYHPSNQTHIVIYALLLSPYLKPSSLFQNIKRRYKHFHAFAYHTPYLSCSHCLSFFTPELSQPLLFVSLHVVGAIMNDRYPSLPLKQRPQHPQRGFSSESSNAAASPSSAFSDFSSHYSQKPPPEKPLPNPPTPPK